MRLVLIQLRVKFPAFKDSLKRISFVFIILVTSVFLIDIIGNLILSQLYGFNYNPRSNYQVLVPIIIISTMIQAMYEAIYHYIRLKISVREEEEAKQMIVQAQLDALRNQAQPHFFFNTLNTLRDIIDQNTKEEAKDFVDKISDVYRFILESGNEDLISIRDELKFAKSYIHIQAERFGDNLKVIWEIEDDYLDRLIVPMSLQLLLENAIKHNVISKAKPLTVVVKIEEDRIIVENEIQVKSSKLPSTKLGLKNIERRYELISNKSIEINNIGNLFVVSLPLIEPAHQIQ
jgi:LytS/YehU family sensor histidine kinase